MVTVDNAVIDKILHKKLHLLYKIVLYVNIILSLYYKYCFINIIKIILVIQR